MVVFVENPPFWGVTHKTYEIRGKNSCYFTSRRIHVWYMYLHLPYESTKCLKDIPYMDPMGMG